MKIEIMSMAFQKFFNWNEPLAAKIDWSTARVTEKCDGSILKLWHDEDKWHISTNGVIDAFTCNLQLPTHDCAYFGELFMIAATETCGCNWGEFLEMLSPSISYVCELCTPFNRVVVPHRENKIYLIGARDRTTEKEIDVWTELQDLKIPRPKVYPMKSPEEVLAILPTLPYSEEGYVVMDAQFNRTKWKGKSYLACHRLKDNGNVNPNRVLELIKTGEQDEFISYFPEYKEHFDKIKLKYDATVLALGTIEYHVKSLKKTCLARKDFALEVLKLDPKLRKYYFAYYDEDDEKVKKMLAALDYDDLL